MTNASDRCQVLPSNPWKMRRIDAFGGDDGGAFGLRLGSASFNHWLLHHGCCGGPIDRVWEQTTALYRALIVLSKQRLWQHLKQLYRGDLFQRYNAGSRSGSARPYPAIYVDNTGAERRKSWRASSNPACARSRNIFRRYRYLKMRELQAEGEVQVRRVRVASADNTSDIFTKPVDKANFLKHRDPN
eukprot:scaffold17988_cov136-Isochrysis_galbana.AAC.8